LNNEPVAWKVIETDDEGSFTTFTEVEPVWTDNAIPLYTHPAKTLTDEEIRQMNNEPVAWMFEYGTDRGDAVNGISWYPNVHFKKPNLGGLIRNIEPLYTHPAKTLTELSGVEIIGMSGKYDFNYEVDIIDFARAILRKAQEK